MSNLFYRNPRLLALAIGLILVAGLSSFYVLPIMEDPLLTERAANVNTLFPGADAERVESLVTEKLEEELAEIEEVKEIRSVSRAGVSTIAIELRDDIDEVDSVWSRIRDKISDVQPGLPAGALEPEFEQLDVKAYASLLAVVWNSESEPNYAILRRLAEDLKDEIKSISGTEKVDLFGDPDEEITVEIKPEQLASLGLTVADVSRQIEASDAKASAGQLRGDTGNLLIEVDAELDTLKRIGQTPIQFGDGGRFVQLDDIAEIRKGFREPTNSLAIVDGRAAVTLGSLVRSDYRIDHWSQGLAESVERFQANMPGGVELIIVFEQNRYVEARMSDLIANLLLGGIAVVAVIFVLMGWRNALVVGISLPLAALMVLSGMRGLGIPIHQMSVTGLIVALGLLIDNAIVIVDEVTERIKEGLSPSKAVKRSVNQLVVPLFGSTLTTGLAFGPIALMPGPAGEFVGSIAISVILAIASSFILAMTVIPAIAAMMHRLPMRENLSGEGFRFGLFRPRWLRFGFSSPKLSALYDSFLGVVFRRPLIGIFIGLALPVLGFIQARQLPEQFFPPTDRDQFQIEMELASNASLAETLAIVNQIRAATLEQSAVQNVHWFLGESAPTFYYNVIPRRKNTPRYAQALVQLHAAGQSQELIRELQSDLDRRFPSARILVRQLEQGPPFNAPIELKLYGPDVEQLRVLGDEVRGILAATPDVIHTRAELSEPLPKLSVIVDEEQARLAGLDHTAIASQLDDTLEGAVGGSVLEETEELPIRVRVSNRGRSRLDRVASIDLLPTLGNRGAPRDEYAGIPLTAVADIELGSEIAAIPRFNGRRMNEVQAFITAGTLPAKVLADYQRRAEEASLSWPPGYTFELGGESAKRDDAVGNLMSNVGVLMVLMVATLVLSFSSFRIAGLVGTVAILSVGLGLGALWIFGYPFGFMAVVGTMGLIGVAINDAIVVLAALRGDRDARRGDPDAVRAVVKRSTRHVVATSLTTIAGFMPLVIAGGGFWPPLAITIAGGVGGATVLALLYIPAAYILLMCRGKCVSAEQSAESTLIAEPVLKKRSPATPSSSPLVFPAATPMGSPAERIDPVTTSATSASQDRSLHLEQV